MGKCQENEEIAVMTDPRGQETDTVREEEEGRHDTLEISPLAIRSSNLAQINTLHARDLRKPASRLTVKLCRYETIVVSTEGSNQQPAWIGLRVHIAQIVVTVEGKSCQSIVTTQIGARASL